MPQRHHPARRLAAVCFADVVDFTRLAAADEPAALQVVETLRRCAETSIERRGGSLVKFLGDGIMAEFPSAEGAVMAGLELATSFRAATRELPGGPFELHVGINLGEVTVAPDGDLFGDGVNRAARLQQMAEPGQVLVSEDVQRLLRQRPVFRFESGGERLAKGLDEPMALFAAVPSDELEAALSRLAREAASAAAPARAGARAARNPRALAVGVTAGLVTFAGLGLWTAMTYDGGSDVADAAPASERSVPVDAGSPGMQGGPGAVTEASPEAEPAVRTAGLPPWPAMAPPEDTAARSEAAPPPAPHVDDRDPRRQLTALARLGAATHLAAVEQSGDDLSGLVRRALDRSQVGTVSDAETHLVRGLLLFALGHRWEAGEEALRQAVVLDPASPPARRAYAMLLSAAGRPDEALFQLEQASDGGAPEAEVAPTRGAVLFRAGRFDEAERHLRRALDRTPHHLPTRLLLARTQVARGHADEALRLLTDARAAGSPAAIVWLAHAQLAGGDDSAAGDRVEALARSGGLGGAAYDLSLLLARAGRMDAALRTFERAVRERDPSVVWAAVDPEAAALRRDPRFGPLLKRIQQGS